MIGSRSNPTDELLPYMSYKSLREFIERLESEGELVRVAEPVSTFLEMTEIQTRLLARGGPARAL